MRMIITGIGGRGRRAFTLAEVAFSLLIITVAVLTVLLLLPSALRAQQQERYGLYAAAAATSLIDSFGRPREDFREGRRVVVGDGDLRADKIGWSLLNRGKHLASAGQPDLERMLGSGLEGVYPVPPEIARRLHSASDEIAQVLDQGGQLYYLDPFDRGGYTSGAVRSGGERGAISELQKLVFTVVGNAQHNALPFHPAVVTPRQLYPFPPLMRAQMSPRHWRTDGTWLDGVHPKHAATDTDGDGQLDGFLGGNLLSCQNGELKWYDHHQVDLGESSTWEWKAEVDDIAGLGSEGTGRWAPDSGWSPWRAGAAEFRRLGDAHWMRIWHQMMAINFKGKSSSSTIKEWVPGKRKRTITYNKIFIDRNFNRTFKPVTYTIEETDPTTGSWVEKTVNSGGKQIPVTGLPSPPIGLPQARGLRGTDILYEDHEVCALERWPQLRTGMPSLERRVGYRSAALALWARVDGWSPIQSAHPAILGTAQDPGSDPNVIDAAPASWSDPGDPACRNPLLAVVEPPANRRMIHPAQVLALSHLAHAAMLVTGYKPPFVDEGNTLDAGAHRNLVVDESLPFKQLSSQEYWLWDLGYTLGGKNPYPLCDPDVAGPDQVPAALNDADMPTFDPLMPATGAVPDAKIARKVATDMAGLPIRVRRFVGPILNPNPPPYADRGAFDWRGVAYNRPLPGAGAGGNYQVLWQEPNYRHADGTGWGGGEDISDTQMARNAMETALRWAMAYVSENPYDLIVPKPLNRPTAFDQPLFAFDLFLPDGSARRPAAIASDDAFHPVMWGSDRAQWPLAYRAPFIAFDFNDFNLKPDIATDTGVWRDPKMPASTAVSAMGPAARNPLLTPPESADYLDWLALGRPRDDIETQTTWKSKGYRRAFVQSVNKNGGYMVPLESALYHNRLHGLGSPFNIPPATAAAQSLLLNSPVSPGQSRSHFAKRFAVTDRCRQLVFWAADWKEYEDAETVPSAPVDRSQIQHPADNDPVALQAVGQPERALCWSNPSRDSVLAKFPSQEVKEMWIPGDKDKPWLFDTREYADIDLSYLAYGHRYTIYPELGQWGADRNGNGVCDRGPIKAATRIRAVEVGRFVFYDPVVWSSIR